MATNYSEYLRANGGMSFHLGTKMIDGLADELRLALGAGLVLEAAKRQVETTERRYLSEFAAAAFSYHDQSKYFVIRGRGSDHPRYLVHADNIETAMVKALDGEFLCQDRYGCRLEDGHANSRHDWIDRATAQEWEIEDAASA